MLEIHNFTQNQIDEKFFQQVADVVLKVISPSINSGLNKLEISLAIVGDGRIRKLNKMYRGKNRVTDVLSFQNKTVMPYLIRAFPRMKKGEDMEFIETPDGIKRLGEVIICYSRAKKQAKKAGHSLEKELTILLIHGILHLSGYDHEQNESEAERMEEMERKILKMINDQ